MPSKIYSASVFGFECRTVEVEVDILNGPASITIVGLGDTSVQESKERIRSAIKNIGAEYPRRKKTINLAPADLKKHGPMYDLPIALGLLTQSEQIPKNSLDETLVLGELSLSGEIRRVAGALPMVSHAAQQKFKCAILPAENAIEASMVSGIKIIPAENLAHLIAHLRGAKQIPVFESPQLNSDAVLNHSEFWHFEDIRGHEYAKRALTISAAGGHNVLLYGPPGSGKTLMARSFRSIIPPLEIEEAIEVTKIYSIAGKLSPKTALMLDPPFRAVHHTASPISLIGGGGIPRPGEISLAHRGVLFMDEFLEFPRMSLDCLRQPLEDGLVHVTRVSGSVVFPAEFILIAATNPCACGFFGDPVKPCRCTPIRREEYGKKLTGPLLDRIDLMCSVPRLPFEKFTRLAGSETSEKILKRVMRSRQIQRERIAAKRPSVGKIEGRMEYLNARIPTAILKEHCPLDVEAMKLLKDAFAKWHHSGRAYFRILRVARTIADLEGAPEISACHLAEALQYRPRAAFGNDENV